ncbi:MAG: hypothetical protein ABH821_03830 [archaeon]
MKEKKIRVLFSPDFDSDYMELLEEIEVETRKGIRNSFNMQLAKAINRAIELLKINPEYGVHVPKNRIPRTFIEKYEINNLWKVNLPDRWRLCYTLRTNRIEVLVVLLGFMSHKDYDKLFGYRRR